MLLIPLHSVDRVSVGRRFSYAWVRQFRPAAFVLLFYLSLLPTMQSLSQLLAKGIGKFLGAGTSVPMWPGFKSILVPPFNTL